MKSSIIYSAKTWQRPFLAQENKISDVVADMLETIRKDGDSAIDEYALQFDGQKPAKIELLPFDDYKLDESLKLSILEAAKRIKRFARFQKEDIGNKSFSDSFGEYGQVVKPIARAGCYIPGGRYPLISTALMTLIPAKVAGCSQRIAVSPSLNPAILAAASLAGATDFYHVGGVQAIGALAFGYRDLQPVDIIVGPGNAYVNEAKALIQRQIKIDGLAGPSELLALCDAKTPIEWLALDALAQSEHDPMALSIIVSSDENWLKTMESFLRNDKKYDRLVSNQQILLLLTSSTEEEIEFSNDFAPEHLMLCNANISVEELTNYGSLFVGINSAVALGDYCSGPNHTLPTARFARQTGGLSVQTFLKTQTIQRINEQGRQHLSQVAMPIANAEGLEFHYESLRVRTK
ncbi:histidinol dehydrogenase [Pleionea litopenaei]|uniref:Histidinol dehydrogenase n=1 Tax=Pleionea litopenaei TaxID=3070815 RepID=A0AA51RTW3_9GAMM|nr:histidinol dehydrogenase [Pleionea sp. HL-JVS1]WMS87409.1 histidinol dehydrogenase [Pleionea sp. HL-JVS1]